MKRATKSTAPKTKERAEVIVPPVHPGKILQEDFLTPLGISQIKLAADLDVPHRRINEIVVGKRAITAETALLLASYFRMSPEFWMNLQVLYDLECRKDEEDMKQHLQRVRAMAKAA